LKRSITKKANQSGRWIRSTERGQVAALIGFLALIVLIVGVFSFEIGRANLATQQLQNATDAATLACAATLASEDNTNPLAAHTDAVQTALNLFEQNIVMAQSLNQTTLATAPNNTPAPGNAELFVEFINPITHAVELNNSANGKVVRIYADFGLQPAFGAFLGLGAFAVHAVSNGAVPQLDIVFCFDISGSMDDQTPVTIVKRTWDNSLTSLRTPPSGFPNGKIVYDAPPSTNGTNGQIINLLQAGPDGSSFNGTPPETLSFAYADDYIYFSIPWCAYQGSPDLRSGGVYPDAGCPPGNYSAGAFSWDGYAVFTDVVVNLDNNNTFTNASSGGFSFPDLATLVEASRGNLENTTVFDNSLAYSSVAPSVTPQVGYKAQYLQAANQILQPMNNAKAACSTFLNIINSDTDAHFGFVAFDSSVGASPTDTETLYNIDQDAFEGLPNFGVLTAFPRPLVPLDPIEVNNGYTAVTTALNSCVPVGSTNIGAAINAAVNQLTTNQRPGAVRAIVLFTDGQPDTGGPLNSDPWMNARAAAVLASNAGIPVYTIGLAQDTAVATGETTILNDTNNDPTTGGIAAISGHGATFNMVNNSPQLTTVFERIARSLVELMDNGYVAGQNVQVGG
jgi:Flp pilus assembly protein TadG